MKRSGFTLIEMLVVLTVLAIISTMLVSIVAAAFGAWRDGVRNVDNFTKARLAMDTMARDIRSAILQTSGPDDVYRPFFDANGQPAIRFLTAFAGLLPGVTPHRKGQRSLSLAQFEVDFNDPDPKKRGLRRIERGFDFTGPNTLATFTALGMPNPDSRLFPQGNAILVGPGICLLHIRFQDANGQLSRIYQPGAKMIYINVLVMDENSIVLLERLGKLDNVINQFTGLPDTSDQRPVDLWNQVLQNGDFFQSLPPDSRKGIRIFERAVPLPESS